MAIRFPRPPEPPLSPEEEEVAKLQAPDPGFQDDDDFDDSSFGHDDDYSQDEIDRMGDLAADRAEDAYWARIDDQTR